MEDTYNTTIPSGPDWRRTSEPADLLSALNSLYSEDDFRGRAVLLPAGDAIEPLQLDLLMQGVQFTMSEHTQITQHMGDTFGAVCFGKAPLLASVSCVLPDTPENFGKQHLVDAYKNKLRLAAVARTGRLPALRYANSLLRGPFIGLRLSESSRNEDILMVAFSILVMSLHVLNAEGMVVFDYVHGSEDPMDSGRFTRPLPVDATGEKAPPGVRDVATDPEIILRKPPRVRESVYPTRH